MNKNGGLVCLLHYFLLTGYANVYNSLPGEIMQNEQNLLSERTNTTVQYETPYTSVDNPVSNGVGPNFNGALCMGPEGYMRVTWRSKYLNLIICTM